MWYYFTYLCKNFKKIFINYMEEFLGGNVKWKKNFKGYLVH